MQNLIRRGFELGQSPALLASASDPIENWSEGKPCKLTGACSTLLTKYASDIIQTEKLLLEILEGSSVEESLMRPPYLERLAPGFEGLGAAFNEGDDQEIEMVMFDATDGDKTLAEDLWMKVSWLSFCDDDASIRFRFSFGVDLEEDVAADPLRQKAAADLADAVFPESSIITKNPDLLETVRDVLSDRAPNFVERIVYFNAPNGGAYMHHDLERGHAGVVYAQVSGATLWLALPHHSLVSEVLSFIETERLPNSLSQAQQQQLRSLAAAPEELSQALNSFAHDALIHLINETKVFVQYLIERGHSRILHAGDAILLPQHDEQNCCWHSVFCLGEDIGQALSFAIR